MARLAAELLPNARDAEEAFTAGMPHDVGRLLLAVHQPEELASLLATARHTGRPLHAIEHERTGVTRAETGAYLLTPWGHPLEALDEDYPHPGRCPGRAGFLARAGRRSDARLTPV